MQGLFRTLSPFALTALLIAPAFADDDMQNVPLVWTPTGEMQPIDVSALAGRKIRLQPLVDQRPNPKLIGENREDVDEEADPAAINPEDILPVTTADPVPQWLDARVADLLRQRGIAVATDAADATIEGELQKFFVIETGVYNAEVALNLRVKDRSGAVRWSGTASGESTRWGRSYKLENYYEVLSDAVVDAVDKLLASPEFQAAVAGKS